MTFPGNPLPFRPIAAIAIIGLLTTLALGCSSSKKRRRLSQISPTSTSVPGADASTVARRIPGAQRASLAERTITQGGAVLNEESVAQQTMKRLQSVNDVGTLKQELTKMARENARLRAEATRGGRTTSGADLRLEYGYLRTRLGYLIARGDIRLFQAKDRVVVAFNTDHMFPSGSSRLTRKGRELVQRVTEVLSGFQRKRFRVEGHTDSKGGNKSKHFDLAYRRAAGVLKLMVRQGITADRLTAVSFGDTRPIDTNTDPAGRAANRRVEISVLEEEFKPAYDYGSTRNWRYNDPRRSADLRRDTHIPQYRPPYKYYDRRNYRNRYARDPLYNDFERYRQEQLQKGQKSAQPTQQGQTRVNQGGR